MHTWKLLFRGLRYYWLQNLAVVAGVATAVAVLAGALLVGESVQASLRRLAMERLGQTVWVIRAANLFREELAASVEPSAPMLILDGLVRHQSSGRGASQVPVYGIDERFWRFHGRAPVAMEGRDAAISRPLAAELGAKVGDTLLIRLDKPAGIPAESLYGRKEDAAQAVRVRLKHILQPDQLGEFSLQPRQGEVNAIFLPLDRLRQETGANGRVNVILAGGQKKDPALALRDHFALEDLGIRVRPMLEAGALQLDTSSGILSDELWAAAQHAAGAAHLEATPVLTYLATRMKVGGREVPYSLVAAIDLAALGKPNSAQDAIVLNDWTARALNARGGEKLEMEFLLWHDDGRTTTSSAAFTVAGVTPITGLAADRNLTPDYPGITDSENVSDWDPPFPLDLSRIQDRDEDYWKRYRTTPKAWLALGRGQQLWRTRFGQVTTVRLKPAKYILLQSAANEFTNELRKRLDPVRSGFAVIDVRGQAQQASRGATDFGEYFVYFSFFLMISALLLAGLFFRFSMEQRSAQIGLLAAVGFSPGKIRALFLTEALVLALAGGLLGAVGAVGYAQLILTGLGTWWQDAVGTRQLSLHLDSSKILMGVSGGLLASLLATIGTLRMLGRLSAKQLLAGAAPPHEVSFRQTSAKGPARATKGERNMFTQPRRGSVLRVFLISLWMAPLSSAGSAALIGLALLGKIAPAGAFFGAGALALMAALWLLRGILGASLKQLLAGSGLLVMIRFAVRNAAVRPGRTVLSAALIAAATFLIVSLESFRRDAGLLDLDRHSGTGGYALMAESVRPIYHDPNSDEGRMALNLDMVQGVRFVPFRLRPGDDASCLNLYQPQNPRILGAPSEFLHAGRFAFASSLANTPEEEKNPWLLLEARGSHEAIPAAADANSMMYVLHKKLGEEVVLETGRGKVRLRLVAALQDSVLQGELVIAGSEFRRVFPDQQGFRFFLMDASRTDVDKRMAEMESALSDHGFDAVETGVRLAGFHRVENTYLSTFQMLGGLGLLLGTVGLAAILIRNVLERRRELALLGAVGYTRSHLAALVLGESLLVLGAGLLAGVLAAAVAVSPVVASRGMGASLISMAGMLAAVAVTGVCATVIATWIALRGSVMDGLRGG